MGENSHFCLSSGYSLEAVDFQNFEALLSGELQMAGKDFCYADMLNKIQIWRRALEEIAGNESGVNAERADGIAITALAFENNAGQARP